MAGKQTTAALIPAAGMGLRLGLGPKALLQLGSSTLVDILVQKLTPLVDTVLIAIPEAYQSSFKYLSSANVKLIVGGKTRQHSIDLMLLECDADVLLIQDVARPFASTDLLNKVLQAAHNHPAAGAFLQSAVPVGKIIGDRVNQYWSQSEAGIFQAPQAFKRNTLLTASEKTQGREFQSTAQMVLSAGYSLTAICGEAENIKITTIQDWQIAQKIIAPALGID